MRLARLCVAMQPPTLRGSPLGDVLLAVASAASHHHFKHDTRLVSM